MVLGSLWAVQTQAWRWQAQLGIGTLSVVQLAVVGAPGLIVLLVRLRGAGLHAAPPARTWAAALLGCGACYVVALGEQLLERVWPIPPEQRRALVEMVVPPSGLRPLGVDLLVWAIVPALCEELLFRGMLFAALEAQAGTRIAVWASAFAFAAYHLSPHRFVPVVVMGAVLGLLRARMRSVWPGMAFHAANNAVVVLMMRSGRDEPWPLATPRGAAVAGLALLALLVGIPAVLRPGRALTD